MIREPRLDVDPRGTYPEVVRNVTCTATDDDGVECTYQDDVDVVIVARGLGEWTCPECNATHELIDEPDPDAHRGDDL